MLVKFESGYNLIESCLILLIISIITLPLSLLSIKQTNTLNRSKTKINTITNKVLWKHRDFKTSKCKTTAKNSISITTCRKDNNESKKHFIF